MKPGSPENYLAFVDPRRAIRWVFIGRVGVCAAIYVAAVYAWRDADRADTLVASLLITVALGFTAASAAWTELGGGTRPITTTFLTLQSLFDLVVVTVIVHLTSDGASQFAALYILVIACASLLLPTTVALAVAGLACALYAWEILFVGPFANPVAVWLQVATFALVALTSGYVGTRLREARTRAVALVAQLNKARLQASDILRNIRSGIVTVDRHGTLLYANPAASTLLGVDLDSRMGTPVLETIATPAPALAQALQRATFDRSRTSRGEGTITLGTRTFPIGLNTTVTANPSPEGDTDGTATAIFQDITDQKRLDTLHLRAERLEGVAELSASLAHEIKNPLAAVRSAVEQLARSPRATPDEQVLTSLIVRESDRLSRLLTEFLDFARVRVTRLEPVDLATVARDAASLAAAHPDGAGHVDVKANVPAAPVIVEGDEDLLYRAVFNLTLNAVQASPDAGRVSVDVAPLTSSDAPAGLSFDRGGVALRVTDEGPGIPDDIRDKLFDPFFTTKPGGSGLGLSVVHRAIEAHKGFVFVDSDPHGTRVTVLLPSYQAETGDAL